mgnify:CR=1 FL=1
MSSESDERGGRMLLHACCGPCSLEPTRIFAQEGVDFAIHYANSNIFPPEVCGNMSTGVTHSTS